MHFHLSDWNLWIPWGSFFPMMTDIGPAFQGPISQLAKRISTIVMINHLRSLCNMHMVLSNAQQNIGILELNGAWVTSVCIIGHYVIGLYGQPKIMRGINPHDCLNYCICFCPYCNKDIYFLIMSTVQQNHFCYASK